MLFYFSSLEESSWNAILSPLLEILLWFMAVVIFLETVILLLTYVIKKALKRNTELGRYVIIFLISFAILLGNFTANKLSSNYFPNPVMKANQTKIFGTITETDVIAVKEKVKGKNMLQIQSFEEFCKKSDGFESPYGTFYGKCIKGDVMVVTGSIGHGGSGISYLLRNTNGKWEIIDQYEWSFLG
jgi:hypothetical protein